MTAGQVDYAQVWRSTLTAVSEAGATATVMGHLRISRLVGGFDSPAGYTAVVQVPNKYTRDMIEQKIRDDVTRALGEQLGRDIHLAVSIEEGLEDERPHVDEPITPPRETGLNGSLNGNHSSHGFSHAEDTTESAPRPLPDLPDEQRVVGELRSSGPSAPERPTTSARQRAAATDSDSAAREARLNPKYTFETFVSGSSNRFAHAAAVAVAEGPARAYNPLFIYGGSGLGKTHLLHAVGHYARSMFPNLRVRYVNSEEFTNDFINSVQEGNAASFHARYRSVDVLLIDDIQFLQNKVQTQEEFFHTFNTLHNANKQIVITSDLPPKELAGFEERMRTRFEWGLLTDVQPPDLETRIAILRKKAIQEQLSVPDEVMEFIASKITTNIRELEGALIRVTAWANLSQEPVTLATAQEILAKLIVDDATAVITAAMIMETTAEYFRLSVDDLCGSSRSRQLVTARQIAMYLCRELTDLGLIKIGRQFGGRDHTTVMHADRKIRELMNENRAIFNQVTELTNRIKQQAR